MGQVCDQHGSDKNFPDQVPQPDRETLNRWLYCVLATGESGDDATRGEMSAAGLTTRRHQQHEIIRRSLIATIVIEADRSICPPSQCRHVDGTRLRACPGPEPDIPPMTARRHKICCGQSIRSRSVHNRLNRAAWMRRRTWSAAPIGNISNRYRHRNSAGCDRFRSIRRRGGNVSTLRVRSCMLSPRSGPNPAMLFCFTTRADKPKSSHLVSIANACSCIATDTHASPP